MSTLTESPSPVASPAHAFHIHSLSPRIPDHHNRQLSTGTASLRNPPSPAAVSRTSAASSRHSSSNALGKQSHSPRSTAGNTAAVAQPNTSAPRNYKDGQGPGCDSATAKPNYVSQGTQYSPDGYPPTAKHIPEQRLNVGAKEGGRVREPSTSSITDTVAATQEEQRTRLERVHVHEIKETPVLAQQQPELQTPGSAGKKRKGGAGGNSPQMIAAAPAAASSTTQADTADSSTVAAPTAFAEPVLGVHPNQVQSTSSNAASGATASTNLSTGSQQSQANSPPPPETARQTISRTSTPKRPRPHPPSTKLMPLDYSTCNPKDLGHLIATMLNELITLNDRIPLSTSRLTRFHSRAAPSISVSDYLQRLIQHATLSPPILLSMVFYIDRLCGLYPAFTINSLTVHRFLITAGTVASKGLSDSFWTNPTYARIGGIPVSELASLELEFLRRVEWKIVPNPEVLVEYYFSLVERTEGFGLEKKDDEEGDESDSIGSDAMSTNENRVNAVAEGKDHGVSGSGREVENMDEG